MPRYFVYMSAQGLLLAGKTSQVKVQSLIFVRMIRLVLAGQVCVIERDFSCI